MPWSDFAIHGWHVWVLIGLGLFACETLLPGFFLGSLGIGAVLTAFTAWLGWSITNQLLAFVSITVVALFTFRPIMLRFLDSPEPDLKVGSDTLVGTRALVMEEIVNGEERGRIRASGSYYNARSEDGSDVPAGSIITITGFRDLTALVKKEET